MSTETTAKPTQAITAQPQGNPLAQIKDGLERMTGQIKAVLPSHITVDRFQRVVMTAVNLNPELVSADRRSLWNACTKAATDGLVPDGREGALVIFKDKTGKKLVQWMPMVNGLIKLIRQSGEIDSIGSRIVYQKEIDDHRFKYVIEDGQEKLFHDPMLWGVRGDKVLVYAYARYKDSGYVEYAVLHKQDVEKRRAASRASGANTPWQTWEDEMWKKTAIRYIAKRLPISSDILQKVDADHEPTHFDEMREAAMHQLGGEMAITDQEITELLARVATGCDNSTTKQDLEDFGVLIQDEVTQMVLPDHVLAKITDIFAAREKELAGA